MTGLQAFFLGFDLIMDTTLLVVTIVNIVDQKELDFVDMLCLGIGFFAIGSGITTLVSIVV